jgi:hypothetical protein
MIIVGGCARERERVVVCRGPSGRLQKETVRRSCSLLALSGGWTAAVMPAQAGPAAFYRPECISMRGQMRA